MCAFLIELCAPRDGLYRFQGALNAPITQIAFSPSRNILAWTDSAGDLTRWCDPIPASAPDPVKLSAGTTAVGVPVKRKATPTLFDGDNVITGRADKGKTRDDAMDEDLGIDLDNDDWILDDLGDGMNDEDGEARQIAGEGGIREMVSVTKAQGAFQVGSTPMENKKRYLGTSCLFFLSFAASCVLMRGPVQHTT